MDNHPGTPLEHVVGHTEKVIESFTDMRKDDPWEQVLTAEPLVYSQKVRDTLTQISQVDYVHFPAGSLSLYI